MPEKQLDVVVFVSLNWSVCRGKVEEVQVCLWWWGGIMPVSVSVYLSKLRGRNKKTKKQQT